MSGVRNRFLVSLSLANLCLLSTWRELLYASSADHYWLVEFTYRHYTAALLNLAGLTIAFYAGATFARRRWHLRWVRALTLASVGAIALAPLNFVRLSSNIGEREAFALRDHWLVPVVVAALLASWLAWRLRRRLPAAAFGVLLVLSPFGAWNAGRAAWLALTVPRSEPRPIARASHQPYRGVRIVWFIFDEMDERLAFVDRPAFLRLPEFDRLRRESVVVDAQEVSAATEQAIPELTIGQQLKTVRVGGASDLDLSSDGTSYLSWKRWRTVFEEGNELGAHTAIVGFYHPYCRLFAGLYDACVAAKLDSPHITQGDSIPTIMSDQLGRMAPIGRRLEAVRVYNTLLAHAVARAGDPAVDFLYVHASVPHGPNIWNRAAGTFDYASFSKDAYFDNLELADHFLGAVRRSMEAAGLWDSTAVIVTADHGWRHVDLLGERRTYRVPLSIRLPGQRSRVDVDGLVKAARVVKPIVTRLMRGSQSPAELAAWLSQIAVDPLRSVD